MNAVGELKRERAKGGLVSPCSPTERLQVKLVSMELPSKER